MTIDTIIKQATEALGITALNAMQTQVVKHWTSNSDDIIIYSPTGTGKTLATAIPALLSVDDHDSSTQVVVIAPARELAVQTHRVIKKISPLTATTCCHGGHSSTIERASLSAHPTIVVATPGRLLDHIVNNHLDISTIKCLVLDEFDKTLELGFTDEMRAIMSHCPSNARIIMSSATAIEHLPSYVKLHNYHTINLLRDQSLIVDNRLTMWYVKAQGNDRLDTVLKLLHAIDDELTIVFTNTRETAEHVFKFLWSRKMSTALYHGALQQIEREKAVAMFNNGTSMVLVATDLAARGLDISNVKHIIHYELPPTKEILIHRNGRTARVDSNGEAFLITTASESLPFFATQCKEFIIDNNSKRHNKVSTIATIHISAGKKEKVSPGDIVGFLSSHTNSLNANEIGKIFVHDHYSLVAVPAAKAQEIINSVSPFKLKKLKVKLSVAKPLLRFAKPTAGR